MDDMNRICGNCGLTYGAHLATRGEYYPLDCCPGHEGWMDWSVGPETTFQPTESFREVAYATPANGGKTL